MNAIEEAIETFLEQIVELEEEYGADAINSALAQTLPGFDPQTLQKTAYDDLVKDEDDGLLDENVVTGLARGGAALYRLGAGAAKWGAGAARNAWNWLRKASTEAGRKELGDARQKAAEEAAKVAKAKGAADAAGDLAPVVGRIGPAGIVGAGVAGGTAASLAGDAASSVVGKNWDQDVNIDDITTNKALNVKSDSIEDVLEKFLKQTNKAIADMTMVLTQTQEMLSGRLEGLDDSVDDMVSAETGESKLAVQARQTQGIDPVKPAEKEKKKEKAEKNKDPAAETASEKRKRLFPGAPTSE